MTIHATILLSQTALALAGTYLLSVDAIAQTRWAQLPFVMPSPRFGPSMAYDSVRDVFVLFGGRTGSWGGPLITETWEWDGVTWTQRNPPVSPSAREIPSCVYDAVRQRTVLHGGMEFLPWINVLTDTWEWDGTTWLQVSSSGPPARIWPGVTFHEDRGRVLLFGGDLPFNIVPTVYNDMWEWDGVAWQVVEPGGFGADPPLVHTNQALIAYNTLAHDPSRGRLVVYGAHWRISTLGGLMSVTWEWTQAGGWVQRNVAGPVLNGRNLQYDSFRARLVVFGDSATGPNPPLEAFDWDGTASSWTLRVNGTPSGMGRGPIAYDSRRGRFLSIDENGAMWEYSTAAPAAYHVYGRGCAGALGVPSLAAAPFQQPWIGDTLRVQVGAVPPGAPVMMAMGFAKLQPALDLGPFGMPGCSVHLVPQGFLSLPSGPVPAWSLAIPNQPVLAGLQFFQQAGVLDPPANPVGLVLSDAAIGVVGIR